MFQLIKILSCVFYFTKCNFFFCCTITKKPDVVNRGKQPRVLNQSFFVLYSTTYWKLGAPKVQLGFKLLLRKRTHFHQWQKGGGWSDTDWCTNSCRGMQRWWMKSSHVSATWGEKQREDFGKTPKSKEARLGRRDDQRIWGCDLKP